jgi:anthraniloyl-CoA monooxygenase
VEAHRGLRARAERGEDRDAARHAGARRRPALWEGDVEPLPEGNWPIVAASPLPYFPHSQVPTEMTAPTWTSDRRLTCRAAARDRGRASTCSRSTWRTATCSRASSRRSPTAAPTSTADRSRTACASRSRCSTRCARRGRGAADVGAHLGGRLVPGGHGPADAVEVARMLQAHGCDAVDVSAGQTVPDSAGLRAPVPDAVRRPHPS